MKKLLVVLSALAVGILGFVLIVPPGGAAAPPRPAAEGADSARFVLGFPPKLASQPNGERYTGLVLYCGVETLAEPYRFDIAVTAPPNLVDPADPASAYQSGHDRSGWLDVKFQDSSGGEGQEAYRVATNDSWGFGLTLGGRPDKDQMLRVTSLPLGDVDGGGMAFRGVATVLARAGATDPFSGDGRTDNYCVTIGTIEGPPAGTELPVAEFLEGEISTTMPVPDDWVIDGSGSDGGVLAGMPLQG